MKICRSFSWLSGLPILGLLLGAGPAWAYRISGHEWITHAAVEELNGCFPGMLSRDEAFLITLSDSEEDANLLRKWAHYSHFYHPEKKIDTRWRVDSSARVAKLDQHLHHEAGEGERRTFSVLIALGHALHHIQDMASPPHVVPVMHDLSDRFEKHRIDDQFIEYAASPSSLDCGALARLGASSLEEILRDTAQATLSEVSDLRIAALRDGHPVQLSGAEFWQEGQGPAFGRYGDLGNPFGLTRFVVQGSEFRVQAEEYARIWKQQLRLGIEVTQRALMYAAGIHVL